MYHIYTSNTSWHQLQSHICCICVCILVSTLYICVIGCRRSAHSITRRTGSINYWRYKSWRWTRSEKWCDFVTFVIEGRYVMYYVGTVLDDDCQYWWWAVLVCCCLYSRRGENVSCFLFSVFFIEIRLFGVVFCVFIFMIHHIHHSYTSYTIIYFIYIIYTIHTSYIHYTCITQIDAAAVCTERYTMNATTQQIDSHYIHSYDALLFILCACKRWSDRIILDGWLMAVPSLIELKNLSFVLDKYVNI